MPSYDFFVRITHSYQQCQSIISRWALECDKMAVYEHTGSATEKVHIHIAIQGCRIQTKALRNQASRVAQVPLSGNENCSMKKWDGSITPLIYMTKGVISPKYLKGWSEEDAKDWCDKYVQPTPRQERLSDVQRLYQEFFTYDNINRLWRESRSEDNPISIQTFLRRLCMRKALELNRQMLTPKTQTDARTLYLTYCWRNGIRLEANDPYHRYVTWESPRTEN